MEWNWEVLDDWVLWGVSVRDLITAELLTLVILTVGKGLAKVLGNVAWRLRQASGEVAAAGVEAVRLAIPTLSLGIVLSVVLPLLHLPQPYSDFLGTACRIYVVFGVCMLLYYLAEVPVAWMTRTTLARGGRVDFIIMPLVRKSLRVTIFILGMVHVAQILSKEPITSIIAGLGVGGLAVALAAQETIKNFFGSLVLATDRPFEIGDRIVVDTTDGPVESVGMRSTRIRTQEGNLVTIPNGELANKSIMNVGKRPNIRALFELGLTYDTPPAKVRRAVEIVEELLKDHEGMSPDLPPRVHFHRFADWSLNIQVLYWYHPAAWWEYMAFHQKLNLNILERFNAEGLEFAFPTQTHHVSASAPKHPGDTDADAAAAAAETADVLTGPSAAARAEPAGQIIKA